MAFFDELKKNLSGVTDTVAKTSEKMVTNSSSGFLFSSLCGIWRCRMKNQSREYTRNDISF